MKRIVSWAALCLLAIGVPLLVPSTGQAQLASIAQVGSLTVSGSPAALLVDELRNRIYVANAAADTIHVYDGISNLLVTTISGCAGITSDSFVLDATFGKIYAGCGKHLTSGILDGDAKIRVIDAATNSVTRVINVGTSGNISDYILALDGVRHKVYVSQTSDPNLLVIDVATDVVTPINTAGAGRFGSLSINETTNKLYVIRTGLRDMVEVDGLTLDVSPRFVFDFPQPTTSGINMRENKVYVNVIGSSSLCIQDRRQLPLTCTFIPANDWGGVVTNERTNKVYLGVEIGDHIGILDGSIDTLHAISMDQATGTGGATNRSHNIVVNENTNHIFFVNDAFLLALDGTTETIRRIPYDDVTAPSGLLLQAIALNRATNRIYVIPNGDALDNVAVFQDTVFDDVSVHNLFFSFIEALARGGITGGCSTSPPLYCPDSGVTRGQMAVFLLRGIHGAGYQPPDATGTAFTDVPVSQPFAKWIEQLAREGITGGCSASPPQYCPDDGVTRGQMAVFLLRVEHGAGYVPPDATGTMFTDVPITHPFAKWIEQLARERITGGCGPTTYCPDVTATRGQMAVFLVRTFNLPM